MGSGDEEISANIQGSSGQLNEFCLAIEGHREPYAGTLRSTLPALWFRERLQNCIEHGQTSLKLSEIRANADAAIQQLTSQLDVDPQNRECRRQKALLLGKRGDFSQALAEYHQIL
jgi:thioredoxin-like negative regulator of GroEL